MATAVLATAGLATYDAETRMTPHNHALSINRGEHRPLLRPAADVRDDPDAELSLRASGRNVQGPPSGPSCVRALKLSSDIA